MKENSFSYEKLIECGKGILFGEGNAQLPLPPMLMFDRIININESGGAFSKGEVIAELDIKSDLEILLGCKLLILYMLSPNNLQSLSYSGNI